MTYEECLRSTFLIPSSWGIVLVGLGLAFALRKSGRKHIATAIAVLAPVFGFLWAYLYYELNCVELYI